MAPGVLSGLDCRGGARPALRPRWHELDRIELRQVRPLVEVGQLSVQLHVGPEQKPLRLSLEWLERWGGTFGPRSSAAANRRRGGASRERFLRNLDEQAGTREPDPDAKADRGSRPAWLLYLSCPRCARRCQVLYSRRGQHLYGCPKCERPAYRSSCWSPSGADADRWSRSERQRLKHQEAAARIRRDYLQHTGPTGGLLQPLTASIPKPPRMTWDRYEALVRLVEAHETIALTAQLDQLRGSLTRILGGETHATGAEREQPGDMNRWARTVLWMDAWALRQRSWHRRGQPRDTPGQGTRARLANLGTSADRSGQGQEGPT